MEELSEQTKLLSSNEIRTKEQLLFYKDSINIQISELEAKRHNLWIKYNRTKNEDIKNDISVIKNELNSLRKKVTLCDGIIKRSGEVEENIEEFEKSIGKGKLKDELK